MFFVYFIQISAQVDLSLKFVNNSLETWDIISFAQIYE